MRPLEISDVGEAYLSWFKDPDVNRFIIAAVASPSREDLENFILVRTNRKDVLFLGIFLRETGEHIGNIKFEPLDQQAGYAILGILIGASDWRGKGVAGEVIEASGKWLARHHHLRRIYLGVDRRNHSAIHAYKKIGFMEVGDGELLESSSDNLAMVLLLNFPPYQ
jgi:ribosomal-protein-alanine N-acetyltransferase